MVQNLKNVKTPERYVRGYTGFSKLIEIGLKKSWNKIGLFAFYDGPYYDSNEFYLGPKQALLAVAEKSNLVDSAIVFVVDTLQTGDLKLSNEEGFDSYITLYDSIFPYSAKFYFGPKTSERAWLHRYPALKIPLSWLVKRPNIFAEVLSDASPIGEDIGPGDAAFNDLKSMHEVLVNKMGPPSLTEEVLGKVREGHTSEIAGEAAGIMASLVNPATAVSKGVRYLGKFMSILMDRRKQEVKEVYDEWKQRVEDKFSEENLRGFFDITENESGQIIEAIKKKRGVLLLLETRDTLYDLFLPLALQYLVEEIGYVPPHRRRRRDPRSTSDTGVVDNYDWDDIDLSYDEIEESDLPPVTDKLIQRIMEGHEKETVLAELLEGEYEGKPKTVIFLDSATHLSKFKRSFRFALKLPEKYPNISVAASFYTSPENISKTLEEGVLEYMNTRAYIFDLHPTLFDKATSNIPVSQKARLHGQLQSMSIIREENGMALLEFIKREKSNWNLLALDKRGKVHQQKSDDWCTKSSFFSKLRRKMGGILKSGD